MKTLIPLVVAALCVACAPKKDDAPVEKPPEKMAENAPEKVAEKALEKAPEKPVQAAPEKAPEKAAAEAPEKPAEPVTLVVGPKAIGPLNETTKLDKATLAAALPGYTVERKTFEAEGDTYESFPVKRDGKHLMTLGTGHGGIDIDIDDGSIKDEKGISLGSTHAQLMAAWPDMKCTLFELEQPTDGIEPFKSVDCKRPAAPAVWYRIDVTDLPGVGKGMPDAKRIAERPITTFKASFPPLGGW